MFYFESVSGDVLAFTVNVTQYVVLKVAVVFDKHI